MGIKQFWARYKFSPLRYNDGSPCYFRAGCLAMLALCMLISAYLRESGYGASALTADTSGASASASASAAAAAASSSVTVSTATISTDSKAVINLASISDSQVHGATVSGSDAVSSISGDSAEGVIVPSVVDSAYEETELAAASEEEEESSMWRFFSLFSDEAKVKEFLLANRKRAISELADGAAFLTSCGTINSGFIGCRFEFSAKVSPYYDSSIEAADDGFMITLTAKGEQAKDICSKFIVNSEGVYQAFDQNGNISQRCLLSSDVGKQILAHSTADSLSDSASSVTPTHSSLAQH